MTDHYQTLGLNRDATQEDIKREYRKLVLVTHPDKNNGNDIEFKKIQLAYEVLSDVNKKREYDNPESQFAGIDIFEQMVRNMNMNMNMNMNSQRSKMRDHYHKLYVTLKDIHTSEKKNLRVKIQKHCFDCKTLCKECGGNGMIIKVQHMGVFFQQIQVSCVQCNGSGIKITQNINCKQCFGVSSISEDKIVQVELYSKLECGHKFQFTGYGEQALKRYDIPGNLIVEMCIIDDKIFTRIGENIIYKTQITLKESIIGKNIIIPHFDKDIQLDTSTFGIIVPNKTYVIKDKGLGGTGDLCIVFDVLYPTKKLTNIEKDVFRVAFGTKFD